MKTIFALLSLSLLVFSCQKQSDPVPTPPVGTPKTAFRVGVNLINQYNQPVSSEEIGPVRLVLTGDKLQKDTTFAITSYTSASFKFDSVPSGQYELAVFKAGCVGERYSFKIVYQDKRFLIDYQNRQTEIPTFSDLFKLKLAEISTLGAGQINYLQQDVHNVYLQVSYPDSPWHLPYVRCFFNKGKQVTAQQYGLSHGYFMNFMSSDKALIQLWKSDLQRVGFQKGDTVSVVGYGDNYITRELVSATPFACLSDQSSNVATLVLE